MLLVLHTHYTLGRFDTLRSAKAAVDLTYKPSPRQTPKRTFGPSNLSKRRRLEVEANILLDNWQSPPRSAVPLIVKDGTQHCLRCLSLGSPPKRSTGYSVPTLQHNWDLEGDCAYVCHLLDVDQSIALPVLCSELRSTRRKRRTPTQYVLDPSSRADSPAYVFPNLTRTLFPANLM